MLRRSYRRLSGSSISLLLLALTGLASAQDVELVSSRRGTMGQTTADGTSASLAISSGGRFVVFRSDAPDVVTGVTDGNFTHDLFLYDSRTGENILVSHNATVATTTGNATSLGPASVSGDGRWVAFESQASDLVTGSDLNVGAPDVFLFDRMSGSMTLVSHAPGATTTTGNGPSTNPLISRDGRYVAFESQASDLVANDGNGKRDAFLFDRVGGGVEIVSRQLGTADTSANDESQLGSINADGAWIVLQSYATDIANITIDLNFERDVFLFERATGAMTLVSHVAGNPQATAADFSLNPRISADGDWVVYENQQPNVIVAGVTDGNGAFDEDVLLWNRTADTTVLVNRSSGAATTSGNADAVFPQLSDDGRYVAFLSAATDLVGGQVDANDALGSCCHNDVFLWDRMNGTMTLVSRSALSATTTADNGALDFALSGDGEAVAFETRASDVVAGQVGSGVQNIFLFDAASGEAELVSHVAGAPATIADGTDPRLSRHGNLTFDAGDATAFGFADSNTSSDVFAFLSFVFGDGFESGSTASWSAVVF